MTEQHSTAIPVEIREADGAQWLSGVVVAEGRAGSTRQELWTPGAAQWSADGIVVRATHLQGEVGRAVPTRHPGGEIRIKVRATPEIRQAYESGKRFLSAEFHALKEQRSAGIREVLSALLVGAAMVDDPEYKQATAELRNRQPRYYL